jgi:hypothetical protein
MFLPEVYNKANNKETYACEGLSAIYETHNLVFRHVFRERELE